jgi:hypothetical protein
MSYEKEHFDFCLNQVRNDIANAKVGEGLVNIKGKIYSTVGLRIAKLRERFGTSISIRFVVHENTEDKVNIECIISLDTADKTKFLANGFAEKKRNLNFITKTSAVEFCQTTALGRACASLGIIGDHNIASAEEMFAAQDDSDKPMNVKTEPKIINKEKSDI